MVESTVISGAFLTPVYKSIFVGRKPLRVYVEGGERELRRDGGVFIQARGNLISRAVLVAHRLVTRSSGSLTTQLGTTMMKGEDDKEREVPTINIFVFIPPTPPTIIVTPNSSPNTIPFTITS